MPERGKYIVLEGSDGTGKSTQAILLDSFVRSLGYDTLQVLNDETGRMEPVQEPGGTPQANRLRRLIKDSSVERTPRQNITWFTEARQYIWNDAILPALERGEHVITARNWFSTLAYQGYGEGVPLDEIEGFTREYLGDDYMSPDFVAILAIRQEQARKARLNNRSQHASTLDTFESKPAAFQTSMQEGYIQLAHDQQVELIDAQGSRMQVFSRVLGQLAPLFDEK